MPSRSSLLSGAGLVVLLVSALCQCGGQTDQAPRLLVRVSGLDASVRQLLVNARLDGQSALKRGRITRQLDSFVVTLPEGARGELEIDLEALLDDDSCRLVEGSASTTIASSELTEVSVALRETSNKSCPLDIAIDGNGKVTAEDPEEPEIELICEGKACHARYPKGHSVTVTAEPGSDVSEVTWEESQCQNGSATCQVTLTAPVALAVTFTPGPCAGLPFCHQDTGLPTFRNLNAIWSSGPDDVWVIGDDSVLSHFNGEAWAPATLPDPVPAPDTSKFPTEAVARTHVNLRALGGTDASNVFLGTEQGYLFRYDGTGWTQQWQTPPSPEDAAHLSLRSIVFVNPTVGAATGDYGQLFFSSAEAPFWQGKATTKGYVFYGVWISPTRVWMVGTKGLIAYTTYGNAETLTKDLVVAAGKKLNAIWGTSDKDIWAVGDDATLLHYDGTTWSFAPESSSGDYDQDLFGVWGSSPTDYWAVGAKGLVLHYNGDNWQPVDAGTSETLKSVWGTTEPYDLWIAGNQGTALHYQP